MSKPIKYEFTVVGLSHHVTRSLMKEIEEFVPFRVRLEREPDNAHDSNAISVSIGSKRIPVYPMKLGYLRRKVAEVIAPGLDNGSVTIQKARLMSVDVELGEGEVEIWLNHAENSILTKAPKRDTFRR